MQCLGVDEMNGCYQKQSNDGFSMSGSKKINQKVLKLYIIDHMIDFIQRFLWK